MTKTKQISPNELPTDATVIDVRSTEEHQKVQLKQKHFSIPLSKLNPKDFMKKHKDNKTVYFLCQSGYRAEQAAQSFVKNGFKNVAVIGGGINKAISQGVEVIKLGKKPIEQQAILIAGLFIIINVILGCWSSFFHIILFIMGCCFVLSGITGRFYLKNILTKMPWNQ